MKNTDIIATLSEEPAEELCSRRLIGIGRQAFNLEIASSNLVGSTKE